MNRDNLLSYLLGTISYGVFLIIMFTKGLDFIFGVALIPLFYIFPSLNNPSIGMAGLPLWLLGGLLGIFLLPFLFWLIGKTIKVKVSFGKIILGFLLSAVAANFIKILFNLIKG
jgi:hypothetical protein